ncbi:MAG: hypothetical protein IJY47_00140 [Clostridia bacterium]|nr:hypothetical protein [Clostridia bacterium]
MKKIVSLALCFCFLVQIFSFGIFTAYGVEETAVYIRTEEDLIGFSQRIANGNDYSGMNVYLEKDLTINEGDISSKSQAELNGLVKWGNVLDDDAFKGNFDGQGHTISGIYFCPSEQTATGLFGNPVDQSSTVKNLKIVNSLVVACDKYAAILFGSCNGEITLSNLYIDADLRTEYSYCGGLLGYTRNTANINSCVYAGTIEAATGTKEMGGLVGCYGNGTLNICDSVFLGSISGNSEKVGGMVGGCYKEQLFITNSISTGSITSSESSVAAFVGNTTKAIHLTNNLYTQTLDPVGIGTGGSFSSETSASSVTQVSTANLIGTGAMSTLADFGFFAWKANQGMMVLPATVADMVFQNSNITPQVSTQFVGYQIAEGTKGETVHLRLVAVVDSSQYEAVGFSVTLQNEVMGTKNYSTPIQTVYRTLTGYGVEQERVDYTAENLGGKYIYALNVKNIPVKNGVYNFSVSTYHVTDGTTVPDGEAKIFSVDCGIWQEG